MLIYTNVGFQSDEDLEWCNGLGLLILMTVTVYWGILYGHGIKGFLCHTKAGHKIAKSVWTPVKTFLKKLAQFRFFPLIAYGVVIVAFVVFIVIDSLDDRRRLISAFGLVVFVLLGAIFSKHPGQISFQKFHSAKIKLLAT